MPKESRHIFSGRIIDVSVDTVELPNGSICDLEIVKHPGAAAVVPIDDAGRVIMIRQYRYAAGGYLLEVPAGKLDPGEAPEACARRELEEEIGMRATNLISMGMIWVSPGFTDERIWLYLASGLEAGKQALEENEILTIERLSLREAVQRAQAGEIEDAKSITALLRAPHYLDKEEGGMAG